MIPFPQEHAVRAQTGARKARVLDEDAVETSDLVEREPILASLQNCPSPSLQPVAWWPLAFDFEAGPAISQQHEAGCARDQMGASVSYCLASFGGEIEPEEIRQRFGAADNRAEPTVAK